MTTLRSIKSICRSPSRLALLLISLVFACSTLPERAHAVSPPPDGGYANGNTAEGQNALFSLTTGGYNTGNGWNSLHALNSGSFNTGIGAGTLFANTASSNTATGTAALFSNTTGDSNTANGAFALLSNTTGFNNTAIGENALYNTTAGVDNTATGHAALFSNTTGAHNVANGDATLLLNTTGNDNTAIGYEALFNNATGPSNTAIGYQALLANTTGDENTANGYQALYSNTTGELNTAIGGNALLRNTTGLYNIALGDSALFGNTTGNSNTALGTGAGANVVTAQNVICIGAGVFGADVSRTTWIDSVWGVTTLDSDTAPVVVSRTGQLGTNASSERFKKDINTMEKASEAILSLRPVTFHYKTDTKGIPQFGLIAEEVAKVNPALVLPDKEGKPYTVRYDQVNAMLLNEFLKEHKTVQEQGATIAELKKEIAALTAGLQKVSAQLETSKPAAQVVTNP